MIGFCDEVRSLAKEKTKAVDEAHQPDQSKSHECDDVMSNLFAVTELGVNTYNETLGRASLSLFWFPRELLALLLQSPNRTGFCLTTRERLVVFLDDQPNHILVLGNKKPQTGSGESLLAKSRQLIRITLNKTDTSYMLKDNTGQALDPEEIILHIIRWVLSE